ncbi:hypothetical protein Ciccas_008732 [Cichlidogyrus casuarinus]|uniref:EF-hand domain-containing protein n=1 Tax=Cichlidogyrus casuarinus TaxID=1844966 RepID=A0ABD2PZZ3_9PLAT
MGNSNSKKLNKDELKKLSKRTRIPQSQIKKWHKGFIVSKSCYQRMNSAAFYTCHANKDCPSGQLNRATFLNMYTQFFPDGKARMFYEHLFRTFDQDNSGNIDFTEFLSAISVTQTGTPEEKLELAFQLYDIDRNGTIEETEMTQIIKAIYLMVGEVDPGPDNSPEERTKAIFRKMDVNSDKVLTKEEFIYGCLNDEHLYRLLAYSQGDAEDQKDARQITEDLSSTDNQKQNGNRHKTSQSAHKR